MRRAAPLLVLLLLAGCGGHGGGTAAPRAAKGGTATIRVAWPSTTSARFIPKASLIIVVTVSRADGTGAVKKGIARPSGNATTSTATLTGLPYGLLSVVVQAFPDTSGNGIAQAQGAGTMTVGEDVPGTVSVAMDSTVTSLAILPTPLTVAVGGKTNLAASAKDAQGNIVLLTTQQSGGSVPNESVTWTSDDTTVDTVVGTGPTAVLTNVAAGTAHVTATFVTTDAGASVSATAPVTNATPALSLTGPDDDVFGYPTSQGPTSTTTPPPPLIAGVNYSVALTPSAPTSTVVSLASTTPLSFSRPPGGTTSSVTLGANVASGLAGTYINTTRVDADVPATLTATTGLYGSATRTITIKPNPLDSLTGSATTVKGGGTVTGTATLGMFAVVAEPVSLSCSDPTVVLPASVSVPAPQIARGGSGGTFPTRYYYYYLVKTASFTIATPKVTAARTVTITATRAGVTKSFDLTITP